MLAGAPALALAAAGGLGTLAGYAVFMAADTSGDWAELGAALRGLFVGTLVGVAGYLVALILAANRLFPRGRRAAPVALALLGHVAVLGYTAALGSVLNPTNGGGEVASTMLMLAAVMCGPVAFVGWGSAGGARRVAVTAITAVAVAASVVGVVSHVIRDHRETRAYPASDRGYEADHQI
ncbi:hypothetical protein [Krasilnikovia sp. M28-CT-15]|uniref:hypothetical protein n=1 Tax=Krasilnikovia sp. M28-CT-15 TaxID=3373540 RepID=UPI003876B84C